MHPCRLIICEKTNHWASALRSEMADTGPQLIEMRSLAACQAELAQSPASVIALETTLFNSQTVLDFVLRARENFPQAVVVALVDCESLATAPILQEAGAIDAITSVLELPRLARLALRKFSLTPQPDISLRELAYQRMPWAAHTTTTNQPDA